MGTVVHYGRQAVGDLLDYLSMMGAAMPSRFSDRSEDWEDRDEEGEPEIDIESIAQENDKVDANEFWEEAVSESDGQPQIDGEALTYEQAQKLGLVSDDLANEESENE